ncbi:hypothetical protein SLNWT_5426 [Streptomyces albus]|uniref:Uncharacterized protein n=1 Tax=Streptomyces albus (strain ATCC 21838 / DSM 41398 / FERM P-419 / JCM 4703 / NBRC 107858) TaxID=1081613 RepID=A0A0B5F633_STRA4|nr:hypothetical protein SLNWT_5426 [Streptomyces albus]AOU80106.1 hypothetical protein SLNHY_5415 [Streptomyces albus]
MRGSGGAGSGRGSGCRCHSSGGTQHSYPGPRAGRSPAGTAGALRASSCLKRSRPRDAGDRISGYAAADGAHKCARLAVTGR